MVEHPVRMLRSIENNDAIFRFLNVELTLYQYLFANQRSY